MGEKFSQDRLLAVVGACWIVSWITASGGCSATQVVPLEPLPAPPAYVQVSHPEGMDMGDLVAVFTDKDAPSPESLKDCDATYVKLRASTSSRDELRQGAIELVSADPVYYHWCFYAKLLKMEEDLKNQAIYLDERQKLILDAYSFLTPIARAYQDVFNDSRYLRWAVNRYRRLSEYIFYRKLDVVPQMSAQLGGPENPFGTYRKSLSSDEEGGVLAKYGLPARAPAAEPSASPQQQVLAQPDVKTEVKADADAKLGAAAQARPETQPSADEPILAVDPDEGPVE